MHKKFTRGFTLIELLVVIAIIGILASIVLASLDSARKKGRDARRIADLKEIQLALELYYDANGVYPVALTSTNLVSPGYISVIPTDPLSTTATPVPYAYAGLSTSVGGTCSSYHLGADLEVSGSTEFANDADAAASTNICASGGTNSAADFAGADTGQCVSTDPGKGGCYDLKP